MKFALVRNIYFHTEQSGLVSKYVAKEVESDVSPQVGFEFEDSAWHRKDPTHAETISIDSETGFCIVYLNPRKVEAEVDVEILYNVALSHGWKNWFAR